MKKGSRTVLLVALWAAPASAAVVDGDGDGVPDATDVCPAAPDPAQADADADGIGDACDAPSLTVSGVVSAGGSVALVASGVAPGERVHFAAAVGAGGAGPCPPQLGGACLDLGAGATLVAAATADPAGVASAPVSVPAVVQPNGTYALQAAVVRGPGGVGSVTSDLVTLDGGTLDWDADGLVDALDRFPRFDPTVPDTDGDGVLDGADACPAGDDALDPDGDGVADACDVCPADADPLQPDADADGLGDACEGAVLLASGWAQPAPGAPIVASGDVNGDGYADLVLGEAGLNGTGATLVHAGSAAGLSAAPTWTVSGGQQAALFGSAVATADVDGDGFDELIVGAPTHDAGQVDEGVVFVYAGSAAGVGAAPLVVLEGDQASASFGKAVAGADVNGDGFGDVIVGAPWFDGAAQDGGAVRVYLGSAAGLANVPATVIAGTGVYDLLGLQVASAGDVDGDGHDDVGLEVPGANELRVYAGTATGLSATPAWTRAADDPASVRSAGDLDGDGYGDVVTSEPQYTDQKGRVRVYLGSPRGLSATAAWSLVGRDRSGYNDGGASIHAVGAGDVDGDGYDDLLLGTPGEDDGGRTDAGAASVYLGGPDGLASEPAQVVTGTVAHEEAGWTAEAAGDVDGDGRADVLLGAQPSPRGTITLLTGHQP